MRIMRWPLSFPISALALVVLLGVFTSSLLAFKGLQESEASSYLWAACFSYCVAWWVESDRKAKGIPAAFEYQAFVFFLWPVVVPYYLFKIKRWRGLCMGIGLVLLSFLPAIAALLTYMATGSEL